MERLLQMFETFPEHVFDTLSERLFDVKNVVQNPQKTGTKKTAAAMKMISNGSPSFQ